MNDTEDMGRSPDYPRDEDMVTLEWVMRQGRPRGMTIEEIGRSLPWTGGRITATLLAFGGRMGHHRDPAGGGRNETRYYLKSRSDT